MTTLMTRLVMAGTFAPRLRTFLVLGLISGVAPLRGHHPTGGLVQLWVSALGPFQGIVLCVYPQGCPSVPFMSLHVKIDMVSRMILLQVAGDFAVRMLAVTLLQPRPPDMPLCDPIRIKIDMWSGMSIWQVAEGKERTDGNCIALSFRRSLQRN